MIINLSFINDLSYIGAYNLLLQEGYVEETSIEEDEIFNKKCITPFSLYNNQGQKIDCIYYIEYCNEVIDTQYVDGRMTLEEVEVKWKKQY